MTAEHVRERARSLVLAHGWNATAYQVLNPGIEHWFSARGDAVVGYVRHAGVRVVAGAPVAAEERLAEVVAEFERAAIEAAESVCYFGAEGRLERVLAGSPRHAFVLLGAQPSWNPEEWHERTRRHASLRGQFARAARKGVCVAEEDPAAAERDPALAACLARWLRTRGLPPLHFLIEPDTLGNLADRRIFVARRGAATMGFIVASRIPARRGWLIEQFVRSPEAPNGTMELLIDSAMRSLASEGARYVSLGLAPLAHDRIPPDDRDAPPLWLRALLGWMRAHGRRFYNFRGLEAFKAKFDPSSWEPIFAISNEPRISPRVVYAITSAFTGGAPFRTLALGLAGAAGRELRRDAGSTQD